MIIRTSLHFCIFFFILFFLGCTCRCDDPKNAVVAHTGLELESQEFIDDTYLNIVDSVQYETYSLKIKAPTEEISAVSRLEHLHFESD